MAYFCIFCDKTMKSLPKYKHFKSKTHTSFTNSIISRYIIPNPNFFEVDEILREFVNNHKKKSEVNDLYCLLKLRTTTNRVRHIRIKPTQVCIIFFVPEKIFVSKFNQDRYHFYQINEMRTTFVSCFAHMTTEH